MKKDRKQYIKETEEILEKYYNTIKFMDSFDLHETSKWYKDSCEVIKTSLNKIKSSKEEYIIYYDKDRVKIRKTAALMYKNLQKILKELANRKYSSVSKNK